MIKNLLPEIGTEIVNTNEGTIRVLVHRTSSGYPWLILSPGQGDAAESLLLLFELIWDQPLNIAVFDPLGHGLSDDPRTDYSHKSQQVVWESLLNHLQVERAFIGGYSYGAYSASMCSHALEERIAGLILIEGGYLTMTDKGETVDSETKSIIEWMRTFRYDSWDAARQAIQAQVSPWTSYDEAEFKASIVDQDGVIMLRTTENTITQMEQTLGEYSTDVLEGLTTPIILLHSTIPPEKAEMRRTGLGLFRGHAPHARIVPIANCGHTIKEHLPFVMNQILEFIEEVSGTNAGV